MPAEHDKHVVLRTADGAYRLSIGSAANTTLNRLCAAATSEETGGILVGYYSVDRSTAFLSEVRPPPSDSRSGRTWFVRGLEGLRDLLRRRWRSRERRYYIGEWHYHPATIVEPSTDDFDQMLTIARAPEYRCKEPLLLIAGRSLADSRRQRPLRAFVCFADGNHVELLPAAEAVMPANGITGPPPAGTGAAGA